MITSIAQVLKRAELRMKLTDQIDRVKSELQRVKPRSYRRVELETRLKLLMVKQLKHENRAERKAA
jgi:hypothetical protein